MGSLPRSLHPQVANPFTNKYRYFICGSQAGLSAFENIPDTLHKRNASFYAVAALTPRDGSRLGKIWLHAPRLQALSTSLREILLSANANVDDENLPSTHLPSLRPEITRKLEEFWEQHRQSSSPKLSSPSDSRPNDDQDSTSHRRRRRGLSESVPFSEAPTTHPANSISLLLDTLGPLVFPLYRQALLRRRILILRKPPLQPLCDFVYLLSILSGIPAVIFDDLPTDPPILDPLFNIGISDILSLETSHPQSYIACTSDDLLATKPHLFDIKVEFAPPHISHTWPNLTTNTGNPLKATHRDLRHYKALRARIHALYEPAILDGASSASSSSGEDDTPDTSLLPHQPAAIAVDWHVPDEASIAEPLPWAAIAYDSFIWWASAGERDVDFQEERDFDHEVLDAAFAPRPFSPLRSRGYRRSGSASAVEGAEGFEMSVVAYFQRLTACALERVGEIVPESMDGERAGEKGWVMKEDLVKMGLDVWSASDREFVQELARVYFGAEVEVQGKSVVCCGIRLL